MKLFSSYAQKSKHLQEREIQLYPESGYEQQIIEFEPESIMAEYTEENKYVLQQANTHFIGYGLCYPDLKQLDINAFNQHRLPKVFLLKENDPQCEILQRFGSVTFDRDTYTQEVKQLIYHCSFFDDESFPRLILE